MGSFNEDFKNLMDAFYNAGLGNSSLPTFAAGDDYKIETVTEILLSRINTAIQNCSDPKKKQMLQAVAAKATTPYLSQGNKKLSSDMKKSLNKIYETDNVVFIHQDDTFQESLAQPKSTWQEDFGFLKSEFSTLVYGGFPNPGNGDYDLDTQVHLLLSRLHDVKDTRDPEKLDRIKALSVQAIELYQHKSGKTTAQLPDSMKKQMLEILGKDAKIISNTPDIKMKFNLSECIENKPQNKEKTKKPSLWSSLKNKTKKFLSKPAVKAAGYAALAVGFGAASVGIAAGMGAMAGGAYAAASLGNATLLGLAVTATGCGASLYAAGRKLKQAWNERRHEKSLKANLNAKREKTILNFREKVEELQKNGNIASSVFEIVNLDKQMETLTSEEYKATGQKHSKVSGLQTNECRWVKNFYPQEFQPIVANVLKYSRDGRTDAEIQAVVAPAMEKAKIDYTSRREQENKEKSRHKFHLQRKKDLTHLSRAFRSKTSGLGQ